LIALYFGARGYGEIERRQAIAAFAQARSPTQVGVVRSADGTRIESLSTPPAPDQALWSVGRVRAYTAYRAEPTESQLLPAALLHVPRVGLEVPVYSDTSEHNLNRGAGLIAGTALPDSIPEGVPVVGIHGKPADENIQVDIAVFALLPARITAYEAYADDNRGIDLSEGRLNERIRE
jgi:hypothetical protein